MIAWASDPFLYPDDALEPGVAMQHPVRLILYDDYFRHSSNEAVKVRLFRDGSESNRPPLSKPGVAMQHPMTTIFVILLTKQ
jgi:hypothetical protein